MVDRIQYEGVRARPELLEQKRPGEHVWVTVASWVVSGETMLAAHQGRQNVIMQWDAENLASFATGCFICEEEWSERLYHRKCPGEPRE